MTILYEFKYINLRYAVYAFLRAYAQILSQIYSDEALTTDVCSTRAFNRAEINIEAERLMHEYGNSLLRLSYSYLHNMSDAQDVLQDTLIQFLKTAPSFTTKSHEKAWTMRVAINICKNKLRYKKRHLTDELNENLSSPEKSDLSFVWSAVKELPEKYREVIHLFYHEDFSTAEIANLLCKNEATIRSLLLRGRYKLKETLKEVYDFEE